METTKNDLPQNVKDFFYKLSDYLDTKLLYFGSIQRADYVPGKSDIDIDIFTENEYSTINKMQHFLHVNRNEFKRFIWVIHEIPTYGFKLKYKNEEKEIYAEFSIYNDRYKELILSQHKNKIVLPFFISILLTTLKTFYYKIPLFPQKMYLYLKRLLLNQGLGEDDPTFVVFDNL
jgi:predicted nucleotidyltransferase